MTKKEYIKYKMKKMADENKPLKQKLAIAYSMAERRNK